MPFLRLHHRCFDKSSIRSTLPSCEVRSRRMTSDSPGDVHAGAPCTSETSRRRTSARPGDARAGAPCPSETSRRMTSARPVGDARASAPCPSGTMQQRLRVRYTTSAENMATLWSLSTLAYVRIGYLLPSLLELRSSVKP